MSLLLNRKVLLLNQSYEPVMVVGAKRAIILLINKKVDAIENYKELIHSTYLTLPLPSVIKLKDYINIRRRSIVLSRKNILKRDNYTCQYCNISSIPMTIDHIIPKQKGGLDTWDNLVAACVKCNSTKGSRTLNESLMILKKKPRRPTMVLHLQKFVNKIQSSWRPYLFMQEDRNEFS